MSEVFVDPQLRTVSLVGCFVLFFALERLVSFHAWQSPQGRRLFTNFGIAAINMLLVSGLLGSWLLLWYPSGEGVTQGLLPWLGVSGWAEVGLTVVLLDFVTYAWHWAYHNIAWMWRLHRVHHSDLDLDVTTSVRFHLLEMLLSAGFRLGVILLMGFELQAILFFELIFGVFNQFVHANICLPEGLDRPLRAVFITPRVHRVHHSKQPAHTHSNYGTIFSFWDRLFRTWKWDPNPRALEIGLPEYASFEQVNFKSALLMPFRR